MAIELPINEENFCIIDVDIIIAEADSYETSEKITVKGMLDTGATFCAIDKKIAETLKLPITRKRDVRGFEKGNYEQTEFTICVPDVSRITTLKISAVIMDLLDRPFDLIIGAAYLNYVNFCRNGIEKTFTLTEGVIIR